MRVHAESEKVEARGGVRGVFGLSDLCSLLPVPNSVTTEKKVGCSSPIMQQSRLAEGRVSSIPDSTPSLRTGPPKAHDSVQAVVCAKKTWSYDRGFSGTVD